MGLKTLVTFAIAAGAVVYGAKETKSQVFYQCDGKFGHVELVNPNRYSGHTNLHIAMTLPDGRTRRYETPRPPEPQLLIDGVTQLCRTGKPATGLRLRS
jgi:hypothetical protein